MSFNHLWLEAQPFKKINENRNGRDYILAGTADALEFFTCSFISRGKMSMFFCPWTCALKSNPGAPFEKLFQN